MAADSSLCSCNSALLITFGLGSWGTLDQILDPHLLMVNRCKQHGIHEDTTVVSTHLVHHTNSSMRSSNLGEWGWGSLFQNTPPGIFRQDFPPTRSSLHHKETKKQLATRNLFHDSTTNDRTNLRKTQNCMDASSL